jgi:hypothetical protein
VTISQAVLEIAHRYDIKVELTDGLLGYTEHAERGIHIFAGAGLSFNERKVWLTEDSDVEAQLHEVMHVITHPPGCKLNIVRENFILMQVEREFARAMLTRSEFRRVVTWQHETSVSDENDLFDCQRSYWLDRDLWLDGYRRAQEVGLLDSRRRPTFERAKWPADPVKYYFEWARTRDLSYSPKTTLEDVRA